MNSQSFKKNLLGILAFVERLGRRDHLTDWVTVGGGDGMYNCVDPTDSR